MKTPRPQTCPEHNITDCATCYTEPGECEYGGRVCGKRSTYSIANRAETRCFCTYHATSPAYAFARVGSTVTLKTPAKN